MKNDENDENESKYEDFNVPFSVLMQQACTLKTKQNEIFRRKFDLWPSWLQHTMFADEIILETRTLPFKGSFIHTSSHSHSSSSSSHSYSYSYYYSLERMKFAQESKLKGNEYYEREEYHQAIQQYERGMSVFNWIVNKKENWRKQEIEDDMIDKFQYETNDPEELSLIKQFNCSCLLNMALVFQKLTQWNDW